MTLHAMMVLAAGLLIAADEVRLRVGKSRT